MNPTRLIAGLGSKKEENVNARFNIDNIVREVTIQSKFQNPVWLHLKFQSYDKLVLVKILTSGPMKQ